MLSLKRTLYAKCVADLTLLVRESITVASMDNQPPAERITAIKRRLDANIAAANSIANVYLLAPTYVNTLAAEAYKAALSISPKDMQSFVREGGKLRATMRDDLTGQEFSTPEELDRMSDIALGRVASASGEENSEDPE